MLAVHCPRCGRPVPVSLAHPDFMACAACHYRGAPPADASHGLRAAAHVVLQADARRRQLSEAMRRTLASAAQRHARLLVLFGVASVPITLICAVLLLGIAVTDDSDGDLVMGTMTVAAWLGTVGAGAAVIAVLRERQRRLEASCAARPPSAPGEPASCHVCGAPLDSGVEGVARCGFCAADNLVAPQVIERARVRQAVVLRSFERAVGAQLAAFTRATSGAGVTIVATALAVPAGVIVVTLAFVLIGESMRLPVDADVRYVAVSTPAGQCIGKLKRRSDGTTRVLFSAWRPSALPAAQPLDRSAPAELFAAEAMIGRAVRTADGDEGKVEEVFSSPLTGNAALISVNGGARRSTRSIAGLCFAPGKSP